MRAELEFELAQAAAVMPWAAVVQLEALGVARRITARLAGEIGTGKVELSADGASWVPGGPDSRLIMAVRDDLGDLIDLVAIASHRRDEWALRSGDGWALGLTALAAIEQARDEAQLLTRDGARRRPVLLRLFANPLDWLAADGEGLCVLDWGPLALTRLRALGEGVTIQTDPGAQDRLRALLAHGGLPRVEAVRPVRGLAA